MRYWPVAVALAVGMFACRENEAVDIARGNVLRNRGELPAAVAAYQEAERKAPRDAAPRVLMGNVLMDLGRYAEARDAYTEANTIEPTAIEPMIGLASAADKLGDVSRAKMLLTRVLDLQPDHAYARLSLAELLLRAGEADNASRQAELAVTRRPRDPTALYVFGTALTAVHDFARARETFDKLEKLKPEGAEAPYGRARIAALAGDDETALKELGAAEARTRTDLGAATDPAFSSLAADPRFTRLVSPRQP